jgi:hypothetical protein
VADSSPSNTTPTEVFEHATVSLPLNEAERGHFDSLEKLLRDIWGLGRNIVLMWSPKGSSLTLLVIPHYDIVRGLDEKTSRIHEPHKPPETLVQKIVAGTKLQTAEGLRETAEKLQVVPQIIDLPFEPGRDLSLDAIDDVIKRYSLTYVDDRAVALFDIVGFSLYSPLEQVAQLNSLSYSVNAAHAKMLDKKIDISFARTTTGDGFYVWNRDRSIQANINLYHFMHLVLADNALARSKAHGNVIPMIRTSFNVGGHYEFYQAEGLNPTIYSYIVGDVTIELARLLESAMPGQVVVGDFLAPMPDRDTRQLERVDTIQFIERTQETLSSLTGLELSGEGIESIKCYLTGERGSDGKFSIKKYDVVDKHGLRRHAYNAKINIYRDNAEPIFLGVQDGDLASFAPVVDGIELTLQDA